VADISPCRQRAFRERKERHVKDLETKLATLQSSASTLQSDNERLKLALQRAKTENEILRATAHTGSGTPPSSKGSPRNSIYSDAYSAGASNSVLSERNMSGGPRAAGIMLSTTATWDLIQSHPLVKQGLVDITDVCEGLRGLARCDGQGPVYEEREVWRLVQEARRGGGDELI
jgi:AP-1-like transcription factor